LGVPAAASSLLSSEKGLISVHNSRREVRAANLSTVPADLLMQLSAKCASFCYTLCNPRMACVQAFVAGKTVYTWGFFP